MYIFGIRARTGRTLPPNFAAAVSAAFSARAAAASVPSHGTFCTTAPEPYVPVRSPLVLPRTWPQTGGMGEGSEEVKVVEVVVLFRSEYSHIFPRRSSEYSHISVYPRMGICA